MKRLIRSRVGNAVAWMVLVLLLAFFAVWMLAPAAHAYPGDGDCRTDVMNHGQDTYTYCTWTDASGYPYRPVETCYGSTNRCSIRNEN